MYDGVLYLESAHSAFGPVHFTLICFFLTLFCAIFFIFLLLSGVYQEVPCAGGAGSQRSLPGRG